MASERQLVAMIEDQNERIDRLEKLIQEGRTPTTAQVEAVEKGQEKVEKAADEAGLEDRLVAALEKKFDIVIEKAEESQEDDSDDDKGDEPDKPRTPRTPKAKAPAKVDDDTPEPEPKPDEDEPPEGTTHWSERPMREVLGL